MNPLFSRLLKRHTPPMNDHVMKGLAVEALEHAPEYLDACLRSIAKSLPPSVKYVGMERCTSQEEYEEITKVRTSGRTFDIAKSSIYMVKVFLEFTDLTGKVIPITRFIYLPFVGKAGIMTLGGTMYHFIPVLSDKVITAHDNSVFVRLTMDRCKILRKQHMVMLNGSRKTCYVTYAVIYRNSATRQKGKDKGSLLSLAETTLMHYIVARYGFSEAFQRYAGVVPVVGGPELAEELKKSKSKWAIYTSAGTAHEQSKHQPNYSGTKIHLAFREKDVTPDVEAMVSSIFYVLDHFPERFHPSFESMEDRVSWIILLGKIIFGDEISESRLYKEITEHLGNLDAFLDEITKGKLLEINVKLDTYYDLLNYLQCNFNNLVLAGGKSRLSTYGKNYEVLHYALFDLFSGFTNFGFELTKTYARGKGLTIKDVEENLKKCFRTGTVFSLTSGKIVTAAVSYSGDHIYPKITGVASEQESQNGSHTTQSMAVIGPENRLDVSMITTGSLLFLPKSDPSPLARTNPWATIDPRTGTVLPSPKFAELLEMNRRYFKL